MAQARKKYQESQNFSQQKIEVRGTVNKPDHSEDENQAQKSRGQVRIGQKIEYN